MAMTTAPYHADSFGKLVIPAGLFLYHRRTLVRLSGLYLAGTNIPDANHQMRRHGRRGSSSDRLCLKSENSKLINSKLTRV
jgi:hypothetical protein